MALYPAILKFYVSCYFFVALQKTAQMHALQRITFAMRFVSLPYCSPFSVRWCYRESADPIL